MNDKIMKIIEIFEEFLDDKNIKIPNKERDNDGETTNIYGDDYYTLEETIKHILYEDNVDNTAKYLYDNYNESAILQAYLIGEAEMMLETYDEKDEEFIEKHKEDLGKYLFEEENLFDTEYLLESKDDYLKEKGLK